MHAPTAGADPAIWRVNTKRRTPLFGAPWVLRWVRPYGSQWAAQKLVLPLVHGRARWRGRENERVIAQSGVFGARPPGDWWS